MKHSYKDMNFQDKTLELIDLANGVADEYLALSCAACNLEKGDRLKLPRY